MIAFVGCNRPEDEGNGTQSGQLNGHAYVDLGLPSGTLWATCNIGATNSEDFGDYFAWGETTPKDTYTWESYRYAEGTTYDDPRLTKYCGYVEYGNNGFTDALTFLEASDDAATANWGAGWRMPTRFEFNELINNCTITRMRTQNEVAGHLFTSNINGNSIFLPDAGFFTYNSEGYYWSSLAGDDYARSAHILWCRSYDTAQEYLCSRCKGLPVRPVCAQ